MSIFDSQDVELSDGTRIDELDGSLKNEDADDKLMHSVLEGNKDEIEDGKVIVESINQGISCFTPDMIFRNLVKNFQMAENLYGETLIRQLSGYDPNYVRKNLNIPEFQDKLKGNVEENIQRLKEKKLLDREGMITPEALKLSSFVMYMEELDKLVLKGVGEKREKKKDSYGEKQDINDFKDCRYRDLALRKSIKTAIRREHKKIIKEDLRMHERQKHGRISIIYGVDASGSMKGKKLGTAKKSGIALCYKAIQEKNKVGLIVFDSEIQKAVEPCQNFKLLLEEIAAIKACMETDLAGTIKKAVEMFPKDNSTKHFILITDALPTKGNEPVSETLEAASFARNNDVTISVLGINLDKEGLDVARQIAEIGNGRLYKIRNLDDMDAMVLEDYYSL